MQPWASAGARSRPTLKLPQAARFDIQVLADAESLIAAWNERQSQVDALAVRTDESAPRWRAGSVRHDARRCATALSEQFEPKGSAMGPLDQALPGTEKIMRIRH